MSLKENLKSPVNNPEDIQAKENAQTLRYIFWDQIASDNPCSAMLIDARELGINLVYLRNELLFDPNTIKRFFKRHQIIPYKLYYVTISL